jgi:hypothetical protein
MLREGGTDLPLEGILDDQSTVAVSPGAAAFLDYGEARVEVVDTAGRVVATFGRHGGGPGEFLNPRFLVRTEVGIGVLDDQKFALVQFGVDGSRKEELPLMSVLGAPTGIVTGIAELEDGSWVYSVREKGATTYREVLYRRVQGVTEELAATPAAPARPVLLPCGITLSPALPVFWPTLRWSAAGSKVAWAATAEDRITLWDATRGDSVVRHGGRLPERATSEAALPEIAPLQVRLGSAGCVLTPEEALAQRGMEKEIPPIRRIALSPTGAVWVQLQPRPGAATIRVHSGSTVDTLTSGPFPSYFLAPDRFLATADSTGGAGIGVWGIHAAEGGASASH